MSKYIFLAGIGLALACGPRPGQSGTAKVKSGRGTKPLSITLERPTLTGDAAPAPVLGVLQSELARHMSVLGKLKNNPPYYLSYQVTERTQTAMTATLGALTGSAQSRRRALDVDVRVGDKHLDNTHPMRGEAYGAPRDQRESWLVPLDDDASALSPTLWIATDKSYKAAVEAYMQVKGNEAVTAAGDDKSDDFSVEEPLQYLEAPRTLEVDRGKWEQTVRRLSARFAAHPQILDSAVSLQADVDTRFFTSSEGAQVQVSRTYIVLSWHASARTDDGMDLGRYDAINVGSFERMPPMKEIEARVQRVIDDLLALREAPLVEPYLGPAILDGEAAGVFFHEVFGHRVEGHRQKGAEEGQTFAKQVGKRVMPSFIDIYDEPGIATLNGIELRGFYAVDDEGVRGSRANLVEAGVLRGFLLSRSPTRGFTRSNGHGRRQEGQAVVARQGNLIVHPQQVVSTQQLKQELLAEVKRQNKPYGLRFAQVEGGFTQTTRYSPQSFRVSPVMVYRVHPDGREELVRGVDIDGTPLTSLSQILAASDDIAVFNGTCGAESGWVPVSAASPSLLIGRVEVSRKFTAQEKTPILPPPGDGGDAAGGAQ